MSQPLQWVPVGERPDLVGGPVHTALDEWRHADEVRVAEIDPELADTATFCEHYGVRLDQSANCVVVSVRRGEKSRLAACVVLASTRADVNGLVRRHLGARKATFASMDTAVAETGMEYGGITPVGLPTDWPLLVDAAVAGSPWVVIGSGVRRSKLSLPGHHVAGVADAEVLPGLAR